MGYYIDYIGTWYWIGVFYLLFSKLLDFMNGTMLEAGYVQTDQLFLLKYRNKALRIWFQIHPPKSKFMIATKSKLAAKYKIPQSPRWQNN